MAEERFAWRPGWTPRGVSPEVAFQEFERLRAQHGKLNAEIVFEAAVPEDAPFHPAFVWDGDTAVRQLGLDTARTMIRALRVVVEERSRPHYVAVPQPHPAHGRPRVIYRPLAEVATNEEDLTLAITHLTNELQQAQMALDEVKEFVAGRDGDAGRMGLIMGISEALATARELARSLR